MSRLIQQNRHSSPGHFVDRSGRSYPSDPTDHARAFLVLAVIVLVLALLGGVTGGMGA